MNAKFKKRVLRVLKYVLLSLLFLIVLTVGFINLPFAHRLITNKVNDEFRDKGLPIHVGHVSVLLNGSVELSRLEVKSSTGDTIVYAGSVKISVGLIPLLSNRVVVGNIELNDATVNLHADSNTGEIDLLSLFSSSSPEEKKVEAKKNPWDIEVWQVHLNNIRFSYTDSLSGILIRQTLNKADLSFTMFSLLKKQIDAANIEIEKASGYLSLFNGVSDTIDTSSSPSAWKFSVNDLELSDADYQIDQPGIYQKTFYSLTHADISVKVLDLAKSELIVQQIKLVDPGMEIETSAAISKSDTMEEQGKNISSGNTWALECGLIKIENGSFHYEMIDSSQKNGFSAWMPVEKFNTTIKDVTYNARASAFDLNELSCELNDQATIRSGVISLESDSAKKGKLLLDMVVFMHMDNQELMANNLVQISTALYGSMDSLEIKKCNIASSSGIDISVAGYITELIKMPESKCKLDFRTSPITRDQTSDLIALSGNRINLPNFDPVSYSGNIAHSFLKPEFNLAMQSLSGDIRLKGNYNVKNKNGKLDATLSQVKLQEIVGKAYPESVTAIAFFDGGMNSKNMVSGNGSVEIQSVIYKKESYQDINLDLSVSDNQGTYTLMSDDSALLCNLNGSFGWSENMYTGTMSGNFNLNDANKNLLPGQVSFKSEIVSDFKSTGKDIQASVDMKNITIGKLNKEVNLESFSGKINLLNNLVSSHVATDFLTADFESHSSFGDLNAAIDSIHFEKVLSLDSADFLRLNAVTILPAFNLTAAVNYHPIFQLLYPDSVLNFDTLHLAIAKNADSAFVQGEITEKRISYSGNEVYGLKVLMNFDEHKLNFHADIDSIDAAGIPLGASTLGIDILPASMRGSLSVASRKDEPLYRLGAEMLKERGRLLMRSTESEWVINSNTWNISPAEFLTRENTSKEIAADLHLQHEDMKIELTGRESDSLQLILENVSVSSLISPVLFKNLPDGSINANAVYSGGEHRNLNFNVDVREFKWKGLDLEKITSTGKLAGDTSGILEARITAGLNDSSRIEAVSESGNNAAVKKFHTTFNSLPVMLLKPFVGEYLDSLQGTASGELALRVENENSSIDGEVRLKQIILKVVPLESWFHIPDDKLVVEKSKLRFDQFTVLDSSEKPLYVNGVINLEKPDSILADLNIKTANLKLMNTTVKDDPVFYGTMVVNAGLDIKGPIVKPSVKGSVALVNGTDITYRQMEDLSVKETESTVTFARFNVDSMVSKSTLRVREFAGRPMIQTTIEIDPKSIFNIKYASGFDINVKVSGNGLLNYTMLPNNTISLAGSYEITSGTSELKFTGWPMKKFSITPGSSLQWNGKYDDPRIDIEATSKVKGSYVNPIDNKDRTVDFIVSMKLLDQLSQLKIIFDVKSNDQYISNVFASLSSDEVMRQAINLLIFESVDLPGMESSTDYVTAQMNNFWESQLNSLTKTTVKNVDISFGIDTRKQVSSSGAEEEKTSLSYEVERKFFKNRASVKVSGRVNDDSNITGKQSSNVVENFTFEYALDTLDKKYLKVYRNQDYEDVLEGEVIKSGVGFIYRRTYRNLSDIWKRKSNKKTDSAPTRGKEN